MKPKAVKHRAIVLHGSLQGKNFGDVLLLATYTNWIRSIAPNLPIKTSNAGNFARSYSGLVKSKEPTYLASKLREPVIFIGGGYLGEPPNNKTLWTARLFKHHLAYGLSIRIRRYPYCVIGAGAGPLTYPFAKYFVRLFISGAEIVALRDKESILFAKSLNIPKVRIVEVADAILGLDYGELCSFIKKPQPLTFSELNGPKILIHMPGSEENASTRRALLKILIEEAQSQNAGIVVMSDNLLGHYFDYFHWAEQILAGQSNYSVVPYRGPSSVLSLIKTADLVVTTKLHVGICAAVLNKQVISIAKHSKTERLYRQLGRPEITSNLKNTDMNIFRINVRESLNGSVLPLQVPAVLKKLGRENKKHIKDFIVRHYKTD